MIVWVLLTERCILFGRAAAGGNRDHDGLAIEEQWCQKDKEDVVEECHHQQDRCDVHVVELDKTKERNAHARSHNVLHHPEERVGFRIQRRKGNDQPPQAKTVAHEEGKNVNDRNVTEFFRVRLKANAILGFSSPEDRPEERTKDDLHDGTGTPKAIHDLDDIVDL